MSKSLDIEEELEKGKKLGNKTFIKDSELNVLVVTRGHPFERDPFFEMIDSLGFEWSHIEHPAAQSFFEEKQIKPYKVEEKIYDWLTNERITFDMLIKQYCIRKEMKSISTLHNKLIIQINDKFFVFSLKNVDDSHRLLETIENYFRQNGRDDAIFIKDTSIIQRKWIYDLLVRNGFNKQKLYRQTTTFSKRK